MDKKYTVEKGMRGFWIIRGPDGQSVQSCESKAYALEVAAKFEKNGPDGISGQEKWRLSGRASS